MDDVAHLQGCELFLKEAGLFTLGGKACSHSVPHFRQSEANLGTWEETCFATVSIHASQPAN